MYKNALLMIALLSIGVGLEARVIVVDDDGTGDYMTIQEAVAVADSGDTVFVKKGRYSGEVYLNIPISLSGEDMDSTIIEGVWKSHIIEVGGANCIIQKFTFLAQNLAIIGVKCPGTSPRIAYNNFRWKIGSSEAIGIWCESGAFPLIQYNNFYMSPADGYAIGLFGDTLNVDARYNFWNTTNESVIQEMILDSLDIQNLGTVNYNPWLEEPVGMGEEFLQNTPAFFLIQNVTSPSNNISRILYQLAGKSSMMVNLKVYNSMGELIKILVEKIQIPGIHTVDWDGKDYHGKSVPIGLYFYRMEVGGYAAVKKVIITK